ncbi:MAG: 50S ribosomal protein L32 [Patescibacteria group bacterium]
MPVPARRKSSSSVRRGASHMALKPVTTSICTSCNAPIMPHKACPKCGMYRGRATKTKK